MRLFVVALFFAAGVVGAAPAAEHRDMTHGLTNHRPGGRDLPGREIINAMMAKTDEAKRSFEKQMERRRQ